MLKPQLVTEGVNRGDVGDILDDDKEGLGADLGGVGLGGAQPG